MATQTKTEFKWNPQYLSGKSSERGNWEIKEGEEETNLTVFNRTTPKIIPSYNVSWGYNWEVKVTAQLEQIDLNKLTLLRSIKAKVLDPKVLYEAEIHVLWISYLPANLYKENMKIGTIFTQTTDDTDGLMQYNICPVTQFTHHIFFPGHAISLKDGLIPWAITLDNSGLNVSPDYIIGKCYIKLVGKSGDIPAYELEQNSKMIALIPEDEPMAGLTYSAPRLPTSKWKEGFVKRGVQNKKTLDKLIALQKIGVDTEALALLGKLKGVLKKLKIEDLQDLESEDTRKYVANLVHKSVKAIKG